LIVPVGCFQDVTKSWGTNGAYPTIKASLRAADAADVKCFCSPNGVPWVFRGIPLPMITDNPRKKSRNWSNAMTAFNSTTRTLLAFFAAMALMIVVVLATFSATSSDHAAATWHKVLAAATWHSTSSAATWNTVSAAATWNKIPTTGTTNASTWY
jgi:hypothetical protein